MSTTATYLKTLRRIPDDIVLSMATREINLDNGETCICGWALRETVARATNKDAGRTAVSDFLDLDRHLANVFGGTKDEWAALYFESGFYGGGAPHVEAAFVTRVMEAAGVAAS